MTPQIQTLLQPIQNLLENPVVLLVVVTWELVWKGLGMWDTARAGRKYWFLALLLVNSVGFLPLAYWFYFRKKTTVATAPTTHSN